jgi:hypothetical protein
VRPAILIQLSPVAQLARVSLLHPGRQQADYLTVIAELASACAACGVTDRQTPCLALETSAELAAAGAAFDWTDRQTKCLALAFS